MQLTDVTSRSTKEKPTKRHETSPRSVRLKKKVLQLVLSTRRRTQMSRRDVKQQRAQAFKEKGLRLGLRIERHGAATRLTAGKHNES